MILGTQKKFEVSSSFQSQDIGCQTWVLEIAQFSPVENDIDYRDF